MILEYFTDKTLHHVHYLWFEAVLNRQHTAGGLVFDPRSGQTLVFKTGSESSTAKRSVTGVIVTGLRG